MRRRAEATRSTRLCGFIFEARRGGAQRAACALDIASGLREVRVGFEQAFEEPRRWDDASRASPFISAKPSGTIFDAAQSHAMLDVEGGARGSKCIAFGELVEAAASSRTFDDARSLASVVTPDRASGIMPIGELVGFVHGALERPFEVHSLLRPRHLQSIPELVTGVACSTERAVGSGGANSPLARRSDARFRETAASRSAESLVLPCDRAIEPAARARADARSDSTAGERRLGELLRRAGEEAEGVVARVDRSRAACVRPSPTRSDDWSRRRVRHRRALEPRRAPARSAVMSAGNGGQRTRGDSCTSRSLRAAFGSRQFSTLCVSAVLCLESGKRPIRASLRASSMRIGARSRARSRHGASGIQQCDHAGFTPLDLEASTRGNVSRS